MPKFCAPSRHRSSEHLKTATCLEGDVATSRSAQGFVFVSADHSYGPKGMPQRGDRTQPRVLCPFEAPRSGYLKTVSCLEGPEDSAPISNLLAPVIPTARRACPKGATGVSPGF